MQLTPLAFSTGSLTRFDEMTAALEDPRPSPTEDQLDQLGTCLMTELLDTVMTTTLEDHQGLIAETFIGGLHSAVQRLEREADRARDDARRLDRDFDGSEIADSELQEAIRKAHALDVTVKAMEFVRDAASTTYTAATGEVWTAWRGNVKASRATAAQIQAKDMIRAAAAAKHALVTPGAPVVAFRGSPKADTREDANRIFDALNWAHKQWPNMVLATTGAPGAEKLAIKWARQKGVTLVTAAADFNSHARRAPFVANDEMLALDPVCCLTLPNTLSEARGVNTEPFGPALNFGQKAQTKGVQHIAIVARA